MKVACVSVSRADWNALGMVAIALRGQGADVVVGIGPNHDAPEMIRADGFAPVAIDWSEVDAGVLCGDRHDTLVAATVMALRAVPVAHLAGGDITEGSQDDSYRHAITKLAHLHFPTHAAAAARVLQMGEEGWRVMAFGSASIDRIRATQPLSRGDALGAAAVPTDAERVVVVNWQPDTLAHPDAGLAAIIQVTRRLQERQVVHIVVVGPNDDPGSDDVLAALQRWSTGSMSVHAVHHLKPQVYLSLLRHADLLIGNSSSAYYEAAYLGCPAIDVGDRQKGRPTCGNIVHAQPTAEDIADAVHASWRVRTARLDAYPTPFGSGNAAPAIAKAILIQGADRQRLLRKKFIDRRDPPMMDDAAFDEVPIV